MQIPLLVFPQVIRQLIIMKDVKKYGISMVVVKNALAHPGALASICLRAAMKGFGN